MSIAIRLNILLLAAALLLGSLAAAIAAQRDHQAHLDMITETVSARLPGQTRLQYSIYSNDVAGLESDLAVFMADPAVTSALAYSGPGELLARLDTPGARRLETVPFSTIRSSLMAADSGLVSLDTRGEVVAASLVASLMRPDAPLYFSLPVVTAVNPAERGLGPLDFALAQVSGDTAGSQRVIGYLHLLIDRASLVQAVLPTILHMFLFSLLCAAACALTSWYFTRHLTRSLVQLAQLADDVASGVQQEPVQIDGSSEIREIASVFNGMIGGMSHARREANVDRHLLSMKVEERSAQLTQRKRELDSAVEEVNQTRHQLHHLSNYDSLTQLPNRHLFTEQLDLLLKLNRRNRHNLALLFIDLVDLKRVSDALGLRAGDQLLGIVAERLLEGVRESDSVGHFVNEGNQIDVSRLGADEFTVVLNQVESSESAGLVAQRLLARLKLPMVIEEHELVINPSVGIALAPADGSAAEELLRAASAAKSHGRDTGAPLAFYSSELESSGEDRIRLEADLRKAIARNELVLHYQPQVDTHSGAVVGAEALLRWNHNERGQIPPGQFISIAEEIGIMDELNNWVLEQACEQLMRFNARGVKLPRIAINVSAGQFSSSFVQRVAEVIGDSGISPEQLELGLGEAVMSSHEKDTVDALSALKEIGVYLSVDDFGTGYAPLNYLGQYPLDELKINRSFLRECGRSENGARLLVAVIAMAKSLGLRVLASGVESEEEFRFLTENGAHIIQGYLFSKPVPAEELQPMLGAWHFVEQVQKLANASPASALDRLSQFE